MGTARSWTLETRGMSGLGDIQRTQAAGPSLEPGERVVVVDRAAFLDDVLEALREKRGRAGIAMAIEHLEARFSTPEGGRMSTEARWLEGGSERDYFEGTGQRVYCASCDQFVDGPCTEPVDMGGGMIDRPCDLEVPRVS